MPSKVFPKGSMLWMEDENEVAVPVTVVADFVRGKPGYVQLPDSKKHIKFSAEESANAKTVNKMVLKGTPNLVNLRDEDLHNASILYNLKVRFQRNSIYTNIGSVLISVNPFKGLPLYTPEVLGKYRAGSPPDGKQLAPHLYATADRSYQQMIKSGESQSCLISGESGAGKTEATKIFLQYLTEMSRDKDSRHKRASNASSDFEKTYLLQEQILKANPLLESFGNACTSKNNNSSRFGKWIEIVFNNKKGSIIGGSIINYLLEKSRIVGQAVGERNYHIFYELCAGAGANSDLKKRYQLRDPSEYRILIGGSGDRISMGSVGSDKEKFNATASGKMLRGGTLTRTRQSIGKSADSIMRMGGMNDEFGFEQLLGAMSVLQMTEVEKDDLLRTVAGILHLGNVEFVEDDKAACEIKGSSVEFLELAADQLGMDSKALSTALRSKNVSNVRETVFTAYNLKQANDARDVLSKTIYGMMFDWLIARVNQVLRVTETGRSDEAEVGSENRSEVLYGLPRHDVSVIGVLDIFGFEAIANNSFEQLCINYCNEKLQHYFNDHIFKLEQEEYQAQGIDASKMVYVDNSICLELLERKRVGLFAMLDEETSIPNGSDATFLSKLLHVHANNSYLQVPIKAKRGQYFTVTHYAGYVTYNVKTFLEKNKDVLHMDLQNLCWKSQHKFIQTIFPQGQGASVKRRSTRRNSMVSGNGGMRRRVTKDNKKTLGAQFKEQLNALMQMLGETTPHFVRCIKPNAAQKAEVFDSMLVLNQLRHSGVLEVCRIKRSGYPVQLRFKEFAVRYHALASETLRGNGEPLWNDILGLMNDLVNSGIILAREIPVPSRKVSKSSRRKTKKPEAKSTGNSNPDDWQVGHSKVFLRQRVYDKLEKARVMALHPAATVIQRIVRGHIVRNSLVRCKEILEKIRAANKSNDLQQLEKALEYVGELPHNGRRVQVVIEAHNLVESLRVKLRVEQQLKSAAEKGEIKLLAAAINAAMELKLSSKSKALKNAKVKLKELEERSKAIRKLSKAVESRKLKSLQSAITKANKLNINIVECEELKRATALLHRIQDEEKVVAQLNDALKADDMKAVKAATAAMSDLGLLDHELMREAEKVTRQRAARSADRERKLGQLELTVAEAIECGDFEKLDRVKTTVTELGHVSSPNVKAALQIYENLQIIRPALEELISASDAITLRSESGMDISDELVQQLALALEKLDDVATTNGALDEINNGEVGSIVRNAREQCRLASEISHMTEEVVQVIEKTKTRKMSEKDLSRLKSLLESASELNLNSGVVHSVRELVREGTMNRGQLMRDSLSSQQDTQDEVDDILLELASDDGNDDDNDVAMAPSHNRKKSVAPALPPRRTKLPPVQNTIETHGLVAKNKNSDRIERARHRKFHFSNYYAVREDSDYAKGVVFFNKRKVMDHKLKFQSQPINRSLLRLDSELSKKAVIIHKTILGYCGVMMMPFTTPLAQEVLNKGLTTPELADEIYIQLFKQITDCSNVQFANRAWQLLCMATGAFAPSRDFEYYVFNFLVNAADKSDITGTYGTYAVRRLEGTLAQAPYGVMPSINEISAYSDRPPVLANVFLSDGSFVADNLPIAPHLTVQQVVSICSHFIQIDPEKASHFGIFTQERKIPQVVPRLRIKQKLVPVTTLDASSTGLVENTVTESGEVRSSIVLRQSDGRKKRVSIAPVDDGEWSALRPMSADSFLGTRVLKAKQHGYEIRFVFRCKLFVSQGDGKELSKKQSQSGEVYNRLMFMQAQKEIEQGNWPVPTKEQVTQFAALAVAIANDGDVAKNTEQVNFDVLKASVPATWWKGDGSSKTEDELLTLVGLDEDDVDFGSIGQTWAARVVEEQKSFPPGISPQKLVTRYLSLASRLPFYGTYFALVKKLPAGTVDEIGANAYAADMELDSLIGDQEVVCGVNQKGLYLLTLEHEVIVAYPFRQIKSVSGASVKLRVTLQGTGKQQLKGNPKLVLYSPQAEDLRDLLMDYGKAVKHNFGGSKAKFVASSRIA